METFSALLAICAGNSPVPGEFPAQRPVTRSFDAFFDVGLNKRLSKQWWGCFDVFFDVGLNKRGWVNNGEAGDLRRYRTHNDVIVMLPYWASDRMSNIRILEKTEHIIMTSNCIGDLTFHIHNYTTIWHQTVYVISPSISITTQLYGIKLYMWSHLPYP